MSTQMSASDIRTYVWDHLDVDSTELSSTLLNVFMRDAVVRIISYFNESPSWLQVEYSFTSVPSQQEYNLDTTAGLISPTPLQSVDEVRSSYFSLMPRTHRQVRSEYRRNAALQARPQEFSQWGRTLYLWPTPAAADTFNVLGVRQPDWSWVESATGVPDVPQEFHPLIAQWALSRGYAQQDDIEMSGFYRAEFESTLRTVAKRWTANVTAQPLIMNGGRRSEPYRTQRSLGPLVFPWE